VSLLSLEKEVNIQLAGTFKILLEIHHSLQSKSERLSRSRLSALVLNALFEAVHSRTAIGDAITARSLMDVWQECAEPLWQNLGRWLTDGIPIPVGFEGDIHEAHPSYVLTKNGKKEFHRLAWPEKFSGTFEAMWADPDSICVATITNEILILNYFDRHQFAPPETVQVTEPGTLPFIWFFPVVSNLVRVGDRYCIAWPRYNKTADKFECVISTWKPGEKRTKEIIVDQPADWNSHLSMAV